MLYVDTAINLLCKLDYMKEYMVSDSDPDSGRSESDSERQTNADEWRELLSCITLRPSGSLGGTPSE